MLIDMQRKGLVTLVLIASVAAAADGFNSLFDVEPDHPAIQYGTGPAQDPVAELSRKIQGGSLALRSHGAQGYLRSVLEALNVPVESQIAVFSKTSVQAGLITPSNPRTLFFNDSVVVGWVRGGFIELAAQDPQQGVNFYELDPSAEPGPQLVRRNDCLRCHVSYATLGVPGMLVRSVFTKADGQPIRRLGDYVSDDRSPFEERWGGYYVTGKSDSLHHMGNTMLTDPARTNPTAAGETLASLQGKFNTSAYLSPYSDIVALLIFEHQMRMMNLITRMGWETRLALYEKREFNARLQETAQELVDYMLFIDETPLPGKVRGGSGFAEKFSERGPRDGRGRSLRELDLDRRLLRYPCSYMIYSPAFDSLPAEAQQAIYRRMWQVLSGQENNPRYDRLVPSDRQAIIEILRETKNDLPPYFRLGVQ